MSAALCRTWSLLLFLALLFLGGASSAQEPPPETASWILVTGSTNAAGLQLHAYATSDRTIVGEVNPTTSATGTIAEGGPDHGCPADHFHGSIQGSPDPQPNGCGWGIAVRLDSAPGSIQNVSAAVMREIRMYRKLFEPRDYEGALDELQESIRALRDAQADLQKEVKKKRISEKAARKVREQLAEALQEDRRARTLLSRMTEEGHDAELWDRVERGYIRARLLKWSAMIGLAKGIYGYE